MATFSERLKLLRKRARLTQPQLAEKMGFSPGAVGNWESGANPPSRESLRKLAGILGTTEMFISGESDIDAFTYREEPPEYRASLALSEIKTQELDRMFEDRQRELANPETPIERRRDLLGLIADMANELKKRIPISSKKSPVDDEADDILRRYRMQKEGSAQ